MSRIILATLALFVVAGPALAEAPPDDMVKKLTAAIRKQCPDAAIEVTKDGFVAKSGTMTFTLHARGKAGEVFERTYQEEGPNWKGFFVSVELREGKYAGALTVPTTLREPYFDRFIDALDLEKADKHYFVSFAYGSRLDPDLKKAIMEAIPRNKLPLGPTRGPNR